MADTIYLWVTHQTALTSWLKAELSRRAPDLRFAFSRPGLSTFKTSMTKIRPDFSLPSSFARAFGISLGPVRTIEDILEKTRALVDRKVRLHVFERDIHTPIDDQDPLVRGTRARGIAAELRALAPELFFEEDSAEIGDAVIDLIVPHATLPDEPWLLGYHQHTRDHGPCPGGVDRNVIPDSAPSRAWCKIDEAIRWGDLDPKPGETAVEIGSSPGGATYALLQRGITVYGIDPAEMDSAVLEFAGPHGNSCVHLQKSAGDVEKGDVPSHFEWLLMDVNLAPMVALKYAERFVQLSHGKLRGAVLTLKINDEGVFNALDRLQDRVRKMGAKEVRFTQLPSHRSEIAAILTW